MEQEASVRSIKMDDRRKGKTNRRAIVTYIYPKMVGKA
ncbi:hypothetical protein MC28_F214 (plasmid) [Bacillus thuringiensis MC28]|nr:hypothetical protein MC28_F214 [Bacillus thuringiensis MC28]